MKKKLLVLSLPIFLLIGVSALASNPNNLTYVKAANGDPTYQSSLAKDINLNHSEENEIRDYYSALNSLSDTERTGSNLLKNLRPILQEMDYFSYDNVWKIYEITDREWELSPASETTFGSYNSATNSISSYEYGSSKDTKNDPYVKTLYRNRDENGITLSEARIKEWGSHASDGTNREHIWCQSRGFKASSGAEGPAGTDLHHLRSGDGYINQSLHNDNPYGYVDKTKIEKDGASKQSWLSGNYLGEALNQSTSDETNIVFEPQDSDKGDIARAVFYMAACYNNLDGNATITEFNPNLTIVDYIYDAKSAITSSSTIPAAMSKLSDLLKWHQEDPVDEFEIYRNDLIYNNYQHNRNPFIDYPDWVNVVWGDSNKVANPSKDSIHGKALNISSSSINIDITKETTFKLSATTEDNSPVTWSISDTSIVTVDKTTSESGEEVTFTVLKEGTATITVTATINENTFTQTCKLTVEKGFVLETWMIIAGVAVIVVLLIICIASSSVRKAAKKQIKKKVKAATKKRKKK